MREHKTDEITPGMFPPVSSAIAAGGVIPAATATVSPDVLWGRRRVGTAQPPFEPLPLPSLDVAEYLPALYPPSQQQVLPSNITYLKKGSDSEEVIDFLNKKHLVPLITQAIENSAGKKATCQGILKYIKSNYRTPEEILLRSRILYFLSRETNFEKTEELGQGGDDDGSGNYWILKTTEAQHKKAATLEAEPLHGDRSVAAVFQRRSINLLITEAIRNSSDGKATHQQIKSYIKNKLPTVDEGAMSYHIGQRLSSERCYTKLDLHDPNSIGCRRHYWKLTNTDEKRKGANTSKPIVKQPLQGVLAGIQKTGVRRSMNLISLVSAAIRGRPDKMANIKQIVAYILMKYQDLDQEELNTHVKILLNESNKFIKLEEWGEGKFSDGQGPYWILAEPGAVALSVSKYDMVDHYKLLKAVIAQYPHGGVTLQQISIDIRGQCRHCAKIPEIPFLQSLRTNLSMMKRINVIGSSKKLDVSQKYQIINTTDSELHCSEFADEPVPGNETVGRGPYRAINKQSPQSTIPSGGVVPAATPNVLWGDCYVGAEQQPFVPLPLPGLDAAKHQPSLHPPSQKQAATHFVRDNSSKEARGFLDNKNLVPLVTQAIENSSGKKATCRGIFKYIKSICRIPDERLLRIRISEVLSSKKGKYEKTEESGPGGDDGRGNYWVLRKTEAQHSKDASSSGQKKGANTSEQIVKKPLQDVSAHRPDIGRSNEPSVSQKYQIIHAADSGLYHLEFGNAPFSMSPADQIGLLQSPDVPYHSPAIIQGSVSSQRNMSQETFAKACAPSMEEQEQETPFYQNYMQYIREAIESSENEQATQPQICSYIESHYPAFFQENKNVNLIMIDILLMIDFFKVDEPIRSDESVDQGPYWAIKKQSQQISQPSFELSPYQSQPFSPCSLLTFPAQLSGETTGVTEQGQSSNNRE
ncbi:hypothetical protein M3P05_10730 [Sansalvadorimonas sp. 2012CJ34-2]|uniref:Fork-head domain-containing protein n=1 Tax=Parendozoicomonas callyspongiae TaxID=2942213 RepID=A0ABT0PG83_9GAMM|nr:hypothetical protein [Sansalvadorimonas sp. 2012CJ34-2]MCL6270394.1 hypothetical protein [Sansalvadorimonas sp. 2012CJ34-2]